MKTATITVLAERLKEAQQALDKFIAKAKRLGVQGLAYRVARQWEQRRSRMDWTGRERTSVIHWADLEVSAAPLTVGNYTFLAKLEVTPAGVLVDQVPGTVELESKWMHWGGDCEHCRVSRARKHLFVVQEVSSGRQMAVGRSCLRVFLGTDSMSTIAAYFAFWGSVSGSEGDDEGGWGGMRVHRYVKNIESILAMTAVAVRLFGWCSKSQAESAVLTATADYVGLGLGDAPRLGPHGDDSEYRLWERLRREYCEQDEEQAQRIIAWVREGMPKVTPYEHNLAVLFADTCIYDGKRLALVVSAYAAWHRANEETFRKTAPTLPQSEWLGKEKERLRDLPVNFDGAFVVGANAYGETVLVSFHTDEGHVLKWFTNKGLGRPAETGERLLLTGTVKKHDEYKGVRQTVLTRCEIQPLENAH